MFKIFRKSNIYSRQLLSNNQNSTLQKYLLRPFFFQILHLKRLGGGQFDTPVVFQGCIF